MKPTQSILTLLIQRKSIIGLTISAISLVLFGCILAEFRQAFLKIAIMLFTFWPIYVFDEWLDLKELDKNKRKSTFFQLMIGVGLSLATAFYLLSLLSFLSLLAIFILGYSYNLHLPLIRNKPKQILFIKNIQIGAGWAFLVLFGAGSIQDLVIWAMIWSAFSQVVIGSVVRDVEDVNEDTINKIKTLPVHLGVSKSLLVLQYFNFLSATILILIGSFTDTSLKLIYAMLSVYFLRFVQLFLLKKEVKNFTKFKSLNLLVCGMFFVFFLLAKKVI